MPFAVAFPSCATVANGLAAEQGQFLDIGQWGVLDQI
jgi:hypothetical protein